MEFEGKKLFNPDGDDSVFNRRIIKGNTTNLFNLNEVKYKWAKIQYRVMLANFWIPEKVDLTKDKLDYKELSIDEVNVLEGILSFLTFLDSIQTNNIPNIASYITAPEVSTLLAIQEYQEVIHCYAEGTEILTTSGWKDFKDLNDNDKVAQYHKDGSIDFIKPLEIISSEYSGNMVHISNGRYNSLVTPNHRVVYNDYYTNTVRVKSAMSIGLNNHTIPVSGKGIGNINELSIRDKLKIAYQADGTVVNKGNFTEDGVCYRFYIMKERKINRLVSLCKENNIRYTLKDSKPEGYKSLYIWFPELFTKDFNEYDLSNYSMSWCREFIDEVSIYDGTPKVEGENKNLRYFNTNREAVDKVMAIGTLANYRVGFYVNDGKDGFGKNAENPKECFYLNFVDKSYITGRELNKDFIDYNGKIYCVSVPTGMIVVRYDDRVTVSGNSQSYAYILESVIPPERRNAVYELWRTDTVLFNRNSNIAKIYQDFIDNKTDENFARVIVANYVLESLYFYNGFIFFYNLASAHKMQGVADEIRYINRDEVTHINLFGNIIKAINGEFPGFISESIVHEIFALGVEQEIIWTNHIIGNRISGMNKDNTEKYTKYLANKRTAELGFSELFPGFNENPYSHLEFLSDESGENVKSNFFEATVTNYSQSNAVEGWDEI